MTNPLPAPLSKEFQLSDRISILMSVSAEKGVTADWLFYEPITSLTAEEEQRYGEARREMFGHLATMLGEAVDIYELHSDGSLVLGDAIRPQQR